MSIREAPNWQMHCMRAGNTKLLKAQRCKDPKVWGSKAMSQSELRESNCGQWLFDHVKRETCMIANNIDTLSLSACKCHLYDLSGLLLVRSWFWMEVHIDNVIFWLLSCSNSSHTTLFSLINTMLVITLLSKLWRLVWGFLPIIIMISTLSTLFASLWELILLLSDCPTFMSLSDCMILSSNG